MICRSRRGEGLQQRLPPLLRLRGITTIAAANRYLAETYRPEHNARFAVAATEQGSAFVPFVASLRDILCIKHERVVGRELRALRWAGAADPRAAAPPALRQSDRPGARISRRHDRIVSRPAAARRIHRGGHADW